jgi:hypothetical protein
MIVLEVRIKSPSDFKIDDSSLLVRLPRWIHNHTRSLTSAGPLRLCFSKGPSQVDRGGLINKINREHVQAAQMEFRNNRTERK